MDEIHHFGLIRSFPYLYGFYPKWADGRPRVYPNSHVGTGQPWTGKSNCDQPLVGSIARHDHGHFRFGRVINRDGVFSKPCFQINFHLRLAAHLFYSGYQLAGHQGTVGLFVDQGAT